MYFYLKEPNSKDKSLIQLIYYVSGEGSNFKYSTGEKINPRYWDKESKMPIVKKGRSDLSAIRTVLSRYSGLLDKLLDNAKLNEEDVTKEYLRTEFDQKFKKVKNKKHVYFSDFIEDFLKHKVNSIKNKKTGKPLTRRTKQAYATALRHLKKYEENNGKLRFNKLTIDLHEKLTNFFDEEMNLAINTIGGYIKNIKRLAKYAKKEGYPVHEDILSSDFFVAEEESDSIALTEDEIQKLYDLDLSGNPRFCKVRDWSIIGFWTGLRVSDWDQFGGFKDGFVMITPSKTKDTSGKRVFVPIHWQIEEMLKDRGMPEECSDVEFNRVIKEVCKKADIDHEVYGSRRNKKTNRLEKGYFEKCLLVSSHTCRRSFATIHYLMGLDSYTIMQITGHTTEKNFLKYIKVSTKEHAERLRIFWEKRYKEMNKER